MNKVYAEFCADILHNHVSFLCMGHGTCSSLALIDGKLCTHFVSRAVHVSSEQ